MDFTVSGEFPEKSLLSLRVGAHRRACALKDGLSVQMPDPAADDKCELAVLEMPYGAVEHPISEEPAIIPTSEAATAVESKNADHCAEATMRIFAMSYSADHPRAQKKILPAAKPDPQELWATARVFGAAYGSSHPKASPPVIVVPKKLPPQDSSQSLGETMRGRFAQRDDTPADDATSRKEYMEKHKLQSLFHSMLRSVLNYTPDQPESYIVDYLRRRDADGLKEVHMGERVEQMKSEIEKFLVDNKASY